MTDYIYDIETYPNFFSCAILNATTGEHGVFEISTRRDDSLQFKSFIECLRNGGHRMVGFNNEGFDYPIIHHMITGRPSFEAAYWMCQKIIDAPTPWENMVWERDRIVPQVDLYKIHHFDNFARRTSLKQLEFAMQVEELQDLPFPPGTVLAPDQMDQVIHYNLYGDVRNTWGFYIVSRPQLDLREQMSAKMSRNFTNFNDTKIGKTYLEMQLNSAGVQTRQGREPMQTWRPEGVKVADILLPTIHFTNMEFQRIHSWFNDSTIYDTRDKNMKATATINGFDFDFGLGGAHGSVDSSVIKSNDEYVIIDLDVASYYPNLAIANNIYPEHLSADFCRIYKDVYDQRKGYPKGSPENAMLKLALNGVYGDSNNRHSCFYDPQYTMAITINGQLLLAMFAEWLMQIPDLKMIQLNTDGLTVHLPRELKGHVDYYANEWESRTGLELEQAEYSRMFIRDVNNYSAEYTDGKIKRKGAYCHSGDLGWHQDHSAQVVAKAAEAHMLHGIPIREFIMTHTNLYDFMMFIKVGGKMKLTHGGEEIQRRSRYYITKTGHQLIKWMPPLAANPEKWRETKIPAGWLSTIANSLSDATVPINYEYYIQQAEKLIV